MKFKYKDYLILVVIIILIIVGIGAMFFSNYNKEHLIGGDKDPHGCLIGAGFSWDEELKQCVRVWEVSYENRHYCSDGSRNAEVCTEEYNPVCGWFDSAKTQCVKYPCAQNFDNPCFACSNSNVFFWTKGECPQ